MKRMRTVLGSIVRLRFTLNVSEEVWHEVEAKVEDIPELTESVLDSVENEVEERVV